MTPNDSSAAHFEGYSSFRSRSADMRLVPADQKLITGRTLDDVVDEPSSFALAKAAQNAREFALLTPLSGLATYLAGLTAYDQVGDVAVFGEVAAGGFAAGLAAFSAYCGYRAVADTVWYLRNK